MASLPQAKTFGEVGSILAVLSIIPGLGWLIGLVGFVLVLIAIKYISESLGDPSIFNNMIISVITAIAGLIISGIVILGAFFITNVVTSTGQTPFVPPSQPLAFYLSIIVILAMVCVFFIISSLFLRRSYRTISARLGTEMFGTVATIYLIGAVTTIVIIGFVLLLIAEILQIVAFFSMPEQPPLPPPPPTTS
jgi:uncharacterized membrane protein